MPNVFEFAPRLAAAQEVFDANPSLTGVYVCSDGQCFLRSGTASAHAREVNGNSADYDYIQPADITLTSGIGDCESALEVDAWLAAHTTAKQVVKNAALAWKAAIVENDRKSALLEFIPTCEDSQVLGFLLHGESDNDVLTAINTRIAELEE